MLVIVQHFNPWPSGRNRISTPRIEALEKQRAPPAPHSEHL
jgi:hypothetical protein